MHRKSRILSIILVLALLILATPWSSLAATYGMSVGAPDVRGPKPGKGPKWNRTPTSTPTAPAPTATPSVPAATNTPAPPNPSSTSVPPSATSTPGPTITPEPTGVPPATTLPTLLSAYLIRGPQPDYEIVKYRPRQFANGLDADPSAKVARVDNAGAYAGWDVLNTPNREINTIMNMDNWLELTLNRPATLAVAWRGGGSIPSWLNGWSRGPDVTINGASVPTYRRSVSAGTITLGSVYDPGAGNRTPRDTYLVLFAESDGTPSKTPAVPDGREVPQPNQSCPSWVHDQYVTTGPDGKTYRTWHPQIDPVYWCYFHHEHGSDPSPYRPAFGYAAAQHGMNEAHEGFKVYKFKEGDVTVIATHHFGTASAVNAACVRFHTFDLAAYRNDTLVGEIFLMADHGKSQHARTDTDLRPTACPDQAAEADADGSYGVRKFQVASMDPVGYEPWRLDFSKVIVAPLAEFMVNTPSRITDCNTLACDQNVATGDQGEFRFVQYSSGFGIRAGNHSGEFFTDPTGRRLVSANEPGAVRQYIAPGANAVLGALPNASVECYQTHPFGGIYTCQDTSLIEPTQNIEGALRSPN